MSKIVRTTISLPADLKRRMDKYSRSHDINWSATAALAFEAVLSGQTAGISDSGLPDLERRVCQIELKLGAHQVGKGV